MHILLVDATNIYVAGAAKLGHLKRSDGYPTGGLFNTVRMIEAMRKQVNPHETYLCFEDGGAMERAKIDENYKADRDHSRPLWTDDHKFQLMQWAHLSGYIVATVPGGEADDAIAFITMEEAGRKDNTVTIMSKDHDFKRLLAYGDVNIRSRSSDVPYDFQSFAEEHGFNANRYFDYLCLAGDASDNVAGVMKAREAKAVIMELPTWDEIVVAHPSLAAKLAMNRALMAWKLGPLTTEQAIERNEKGLNGWYEGMEFKSMIKEPA